MAIALFGGMTALLIASLLAGFVGSPHCVMMCGPFLAASGGEGALGAAAWHLGKLAIYAVLGAAAGSVGVLIRGPWWLAPVVSVTLLVVFAAQFAGVLGHTSLALPGVTRIAGFFLRSRSVVGRLGLGAVAGLLPCGLLYTALSLPIATRSASLGASTMVAFGLGTVPALALGGGVVRRVQQSPAARPIIAAFVLISGLWSIYHRAVVTSDGGIPSFCSPTHWSPS